MSARGRPDVGPRLDQSEMREDRVLPIRGAKRDSSRSTAMKQDGGGEKKNLRNVSNVAFLKQIRKVTIVGSTTWMLFLPRKKPYLNSWKGPSLMVPGKMKIHTTTRPEKKGKYRSFRPGVILSPRLVSSLTHGPASGPGVFSRLTQYTVFS